MIRNKQKEEFETDGVTALVGKLCHDPEKGEFAVAYLTQEAFSVPCNTSIPKGTAVTFSLSQWDDMVRPQKGQVIFLQQIRMFVKGWRAEKARPIALQATNNKQ